MERTNQTLQDRLVKELRLAKINTIQEANQFLDGFWKEHNRRFEKPASCPEDCHRNSLSDDYLNKILCIKERRKISKNLEIQYKNTIYQIESNKMSRQLIKAEVEIWEDLEERIMSINYRGNPLKYHEYSRQISNGSEVNSKEIDRFLKVTHERKKVSRHHSWLQEGRAEARKREYMYSRSGT